MTMLNPTLCGMVFIWLRTVKPSIVSLNSLLCMVAWPQDPERLYIDTGTAINIVETYRTQHDQICLE